MAQVYGFAGPVVALRELVKCLNSRPEIMPGRSPISEVTNPITKAAYRPTKGVRPAMREKATASGTRARAIVRPERILEWTVQLILRVQTERFVLYLLNQGIGNYPQCNVQLVSDQSH